MHNRFIIALCLLAVWSLGCGPDARRDNPLDPVNGSGVSGTVSAWGGGAVSNAVVTAVPANLSVSTNSSGQYNIELEGGRTYFLTAEHPYYHTQVDTINVPSDGRLKKNFVLRGKPRIDNAKVLTKSVHTVEGQLPVYLQPQCLAVHPGGEEILALYYNVRCIYRGATYIPDSSRKLDQVTRRYYWCILGPADPSRDTLDFSIDSAGVAFYPYFKSTVPQILAWPTIIQPVNNSTFSLPDTFIWSSKNTYVGVRFEVWKDTTVVWCRDTSNIDTLYCDAALELGRNYIWKVINIDAEGSQAITEARFYLP
jgi:hypothetical protein